MKNSVWIVAYVLFFGLILFGVWSEYKTPPVETIERSKNLTVRALSGERTIYNTAPLLRPGRNVINLNNPGHPTKEIQVSAYKFNDNRADFREIFYSFSNNVESLCLTQDQIVEICLTYRSHLHKGGIANLFLFKEDENMLMPNDNLFVAAVFYFAEDVNGWFEERRAGLYVDLYPFTYKVVWDCRYETVFVPRLASLPE